MKPGFSIRPATQDDLPAILEIETKLMPAPWTSQNFRAELEKPYAKFFVFTDDETDSVIAAYIVFWTLMEDCQILNLVVDLPFRGQGMARELIRRTIQLGSQSGAKRLTLDVRKSNLPAIQLYQSMNFAITSVRKAFYSNGEDGYQMTLSLIEKVIDF